MQKWPVTRPNSVKKKTEIELGRADSNVALLEKKQSSDSRCWRTPAAGKIIVGACYRRLLAITTSKVEQASTTQVSHQRYTDLRGKSRVMKVKLCKADVTASRKPAGTG